jgi:hypothetical protein
VVDNRPQPLHLHLWKYGRFDAEEVGNESRFHQLQPDSDANLEHSFPRDHRLPRKQGPEVQIRLQPVFISEAQESYH